MKNPPLYDFEARALSRLAATLQARGMITEKRNAELQRDIKTNTAKVRL